MVDDETLNFVKGVKKINRDFEDQWLVKFSKALDESVDGQTREKILCSADKAETVTDQGRVIEWTKEAMDRLDALVDEKNRNRIMTACACRFPKKRLLQLRNKFEETNDLGSVHRMLRDMFVADLKEGLGLDDDLIRRILKRCWGLAGVREGNKIIATKLPFELKEYFKAGNSEAKRYHYCHCPRIREAIRSGEHNISRTYCHCGAGFYKDIWERILQKPVEVEVLETVLHGNDQCRIAIHLPRLK